MRVALLCVMLGRIRHVLVIKVVLLYFVGEESGRDKIDIHWLKHVALLCVMWGRDTTSVDVVYMAS